MEKIKKSEASEQLGPREFHVHLLRIGGPLSGKALDYLLSFLPREDCRRFRDLALEGSRREFLWSRLFVRRLLSFYAGREMGDLTFGAQKWGKPFLKNSPLQFNLSHSQNLVAFSVGRCPLGLDVEKVDFSPEARRRSELLVERYFSPKEQDFWRAASGMDQARAFFRIFTMKEAYVKALGRGLSLPLNDWTVPFTLGEGGRWGNWEWFIPLLRKGNYCLSQAAWNPAHEPYRHVVYDWNEETLINDLRNSGAPPSFLLNAVA